ncbi:hypothetical protein ABIE65_002955 [Constrictibacter sp. MBR-5]|jgi:hypothetical protein|uniref:PAS domain-containing protein n=1 Tax=Constrictibacter sp. MBR-5 TaxID=3156467 RepID=UPI003396C54A
MALPRARSRNDGGDTSPFDPRQITHPELRRLYDYWYQRCVGDRLPGRSIVDPLAMRGWLGNITLIDVHPSPPRFTFRLCGSSMVERIGLDPTGADLSAIPDADYRVRIETIFARMVETREPSVSRNRRRIASRAYDFEVLRLPLADDGHSVSTLLVCPMYFEVPPLNCAVGTGREPEFEAPTWLE